MIPVNKQHRSPRSREGNDAAPTRESLQIGRVLSYVFTKVAILPTGLLAALEGLSQYDLPNMVGNVKTWQIFAFIFEANIMQPAGLPSEPVAIK